jgi:3-phosphoshikimate 1-carboxyvinyltransferase
VLATSCDGISRINGVHRLKTKESDRGKMLIQEFQKLGVQIRQDGDALLIEGGRIHGGKTDAHGDHRIAMALAVAGLVASSPVEIVGAECVSKSYPDFFQDIEALGTRIEY